MSDARAYGTTITRTISGTSAQSAAISGYDKARVYNGDTAVCFVLAAADPTATTSAIPIAPGTAIEMKIIDGYKIAAIGTAGTLYITPFN